MKSRLAQATPHFSLLSEEWAGASHSSLIALHSSLKTVDELVKTGQIQSAGLKKVEIAKKNGSWFKNDRPQVDVSMPVEFESALNNNPDAKEYFNSLAVSYKKQYLLWIAIAKRINTREKRISEAIHLLKNKKKLGLK